MHHKDYNSRHCLENTIKNEYTLYTYWPKNSHVNNKILHKILLIEHSLHTCSTIRYSLKFTVQIIIMYIYMYIILHDLCTYLCGSFQKNLPNTKVFFRCALDFSTVIWCCSLKLGNLYTKLRYGLASWHRGITIWWNTATATNTCTNIELLQIE